MTDDFDVVWNGAHNGRGDDSLLPPRDEHTNTIWDPNSWACVGFLEQLLWQDRFGGIKGMQKTVSMAESIRLQVIEKQHLRSKYR